MRKPALLIVLIAFVSSLCFGQASGVGDVNEITKRILSSTRYRLTPGDTYQLLVSLGGENASYSLILQENYELDVPYLGTLKVKDLYFTDLRTMVTDRLKKVIPMANYISLSLQSPARFDVQVYGAVDTPGIVTVYPLSRVSDAIALSKGLRKGGSSRQIQLTRGDATIPVDLLLYGMKNVQEDNPYLQPGDVIFVPQTSVVAAVSGQVVNPGAYELVPGETLSTLLSYAGGILPEAAPGTVQIQRFNPDGATSFVSLDVQKDAGAAIMNGDRVRVPPMTENKDSVLVQGALYGQPQPLDKPGTVPMTPISVNVPWTPGMTLLSVLESLGGPTPYARAEDCTVIRAGSGQRVMIDVESLWRTRSKAQDMDLQAGDMVSIPIMTDVYVAGEVRTPGKVSYAPSLTVADYILASGGVDPDTGNPNAVYFVDKKGAKTKASLEEGVKPGTLIYVDKNGWTQFQSFFDSKFFITTGYVIELIGVVTTIITFISRFQ